MKSERWLLAILCVCLALLCAPICALAEGETPDVHTDGMFSYILTDEGAVLVGFLPKGIEEIIVPDTLGGMPVVGTQGLESVWAYVDYQQTHDEPIENTTLKRLVLPDTMRYIGGYSFIHHVALEEVVLPKRLQSIGAAAFSGCERLASVTLPDTLTEIGRSAFANCDSLREIIIPEGVRRIEEATFEHCDGLRKVRLPESLESIERYAFYGCLKLRYVNFPDGIQRIEVDAFAGADLRNVTTPLSLTRLDSAFSYCYSLETFVVTENVTWIVKMAFWDCPALRSVTIPASVTRIDAQTISAAGLYHTPGLVITVERGSYAEARMREFGYTLNVVEKIPPTTGVAPIE